MIRIELGVEDLANTRFGISPLAETVLSLRALVDPSQHTLHLPWLRAVGNRLDASDTELLQLAGWTEPDPAGLPRDSEPSPP